MAKLSAHGTVVMESEIGDTPYRVMSDGVILRSWRYEGRLRTTEARTILRTVLKKSWAGVMTLECGHLAQGRPGKATPKRAYCEMCQQGHPPADSSPRT